MSLRDHCGPGHVSRPFVIDGWGIATDQHHLVAVRGARVVRPAETSPALVQSLRSLLALRPGPSTVDLAALRAFCGEPAGIECFGDCNTHERRLCEWCRDVWRPGYISGLPINRSLVARALLVAPAKGRAHVWAVRLFRDASRGRTLMLSGDGWLVAVMQCIPGEQHRDAPRLRVREMPRAALEPDEVA